MHAAVIIYISVYFFIARPMSAGYVTAISGWLLWSLRCVGLTCKIPIAYISAISKPTHFRFSPKLATVQGLQS